MHLQRLYTACCMDPLANVRRLAQHSHISNLAGSRLASMLDRVLTLHMDIRVVLLLRGLFTLLDLIRILLDFACLLFKDPSS